MSTVNENANDDDFNQERNETGVNINNVQSFGDSSSSSSTIEKFNAEKYLKEICPGSTGEDIEKLLNMELDSFSSDNENEVYLVAQENEDMYVLNNIDINELNHESVSLNNIDLQDKLISTYVNDDQNIDPKDLYRSSYLSPVKRNMVPSSKIAPDRSSKSSVKIPRVRFESSPKIYPVRSSSSSLRSLVSRLEHPSTSSIESYTQSLPTDEPGITDQEIADLGVEPSYAFEPPQVKKYIEDKVVIFDENQNHTGYSYYYYFEKSNEYLSEIRFQPTKTVTELRMEDLIDAICEGSIFLTELYLKSDKHIQKLKVDTKIDYYCYQASIRLVNRSDCLKNRDQFSNNEAYLCLFYLFDILNENKKSMELSKIKQSLKENLEGHFADEYKKYYLIGANIYSIWKRFKPESLLNIKGISPKWWCLLKDEEIKLVSCVLDRIENSKFISVLKP